MKHDFETEKANLMKEVRSVLGEIENLYEEGSERGAEEARALGKTLQEKLSGLQSKWQDFESRAEDQIRQTAKQADSYVHDKPYYAMGFAALAGLVVGVLLNRR